MARMLKKKEVCKLLSISPATLDRWEHAGSFPKRRAIGNFRVAWWSKDVEEYLQSLDPQRPLTIPE